MNTDINNNFAKNGLLLTLGNVMFISCLYFYVSPIPNGLDTQPYSILLASLFVFCAILSGERVPRHFIFLFLFLFSVAVISMIGGIFKSGGVEILRGFANYYAAVIYLIGLHVYFKKYGFPKKLFLLSIAVYIGVGILQLYSPDIVSMLVSSRTTLDRGVTSLTPEPTFFGIILYLMVLIVYVLPDFEPKKTLIFSMILAIIFIAKSSMAVVFLLFFLLSVIEPKRVLYLSLVIIPSFLGLASVSQSMLDDSSRLFKIVDLLMSMDISAILMDASINDRVGQVYLSFYGFVDNNLLPGYFNTYSYYTGNKASLSDGLFWYGAVSDKVISYWGALFYEIGIISILYIFFLCFVMMRTKFKRLMFIGLFIPLFGGVTFSNPFVYMLILLFSNNYRRPTWKI
ncbi:hypothetical protein A1OO_20360 [Enterovibrio norvegicus FF-33]|uniref:hypothetical protein n=1 Tax=Enterovibrio norvegicus TaxID=188144 RepID=UPI00031B8442|nr:hypothetical protein [Enterovibrio norvegicus]OEE68084.1 hypothetical protein A1OO_20360 [Enterovibrio norvegicus FF-33]